MADSSLQLLSLGQQTTQQAVGVLNDAMTRSLNVQQATNQAEISAGFKAVEFQENQRMHDANIMQLNYSNSLQAQKFASDSFYKAKEFELEQQLAPLRASAEVLGLQARAFQYQKAQQQASRVQFNDITKTYDERIGYDLLNKDSPELAKDYLDLKAKYQTQVASGLEFDQPKFESELAGIVGKYKDVEPDKTGWSAQKQYLYDNISPTLGKRYGLKHPSVSRNRNAMAASYLDMTPGDVGDFGQKFGELYEDEEWGQLGSGRVVYQNNKRLIKENEEAASNLEARYAGLVRDPENATQYDAVQSQIQSFRKKAQDAQNQNLQLQTGHAQGKYGVQPAEIPDKPVIGPDQTKYDTKSYLNKSNNIAGYPSQQDEQGKSTFQRISGVAQFLSNGDEPNELKDVDLKWYSSNRIAPDKKSLTSIRERIEGSIESLGNLDERFTPERANNIISGIKKPASVPISGYLGELLTKTAGWDFGQRFPVESGDRSQPKDQQYEINFGPKSSTTAKILMGSGRQIESYEDINTILSKISNTAEREEARKEIYAALITAGLSDSLDPSK